MRIRMYLLIPVLLALPFAALAQDAAPDQAAMMEAMMKAGAPGPEHQKLAAMAGDFICKFTSFQGPAGEPMVMEGTVEAKAIMGGRYVFETVEMPGMMGMPPMQGMGLYGYDNIAGEYFMLWWDNYSTGAIEVRGAMDEAGALTMTGVMTDPMGGEVGFRMVNTFAEDGYTSTYYEAREGQEETKTMEIVQTRK